MARPEDFRFFDDAYRQAAAASAKPLDYLNVPVSTSNEPGKELAPLIVRSVMDETETTDIINQQPANPHLAKQVLHHLGVGPTPYEKWTFALPGKLEPLHEVGSIDLSGTGVLEDALTPRPERLKKLKLSMQDLLKRDGIPATVNGERCVVSIEYATAHVPGHNMIARLALFPETPERSEPLTGIVFTASGDLQKFDTITQILAPLNFTESDDEPNSYLYAGGRKIYEANDELHIEKAEKIVDMIHGKIEAKEAAETVTKMTFEPEVMLLDDDSDNEAVSRSWKSEAKKALLGTYALLTTMNIMLDVSNGFYHSPWTKYLGWHDLDPTRPVRGVVSELLGKDTVSTTHVVTHDPSSETVDGGNYIDPDSIAYFDLKKYGIGDRIYRALDVDAATRASHTLRSFPVRQQTGCTSIDTGVNLGYDYMFTTNESVHKQVTVQAVGDSALKVCTTGSLASTPKNQSKIYVMSLK